MKPVILKLKDNIIRVKTTHRWTLELARAILIAFFIPLLVSLIIYFADKIGAIDNFFQALFVVMVFVSLVLYKLWKLE